MPFRKWLEEIDPVRDEMVTVCDQWWEQAKSIVRGLGKEIVEQAGPQAFVGRTIRENKKEQRYTTPEAFNQFLYYTSTRDALKGDVASWRSATKKPSTRNAPKGGGQN